MMVLKVKNFCEREKRNNAPLIPLRCVQARVAAITEAFATITEEEWRKECEHVKKVEEKYYADGPVIDSEMERFIIEVGDDSDTSDDEDDEEDEVDDDLSGISPLDEHFLIDQNYNKKY
ncbi:unnamed protein product, partial [Brenthis ino]